MVTGVRLKNIVTGASTELTCAGVFVAIGHRPNTDLLKGKWRWMRRATSSPRREPPPASPAYSPPATSRTRNIARPLLRPARDAWPPSTPNGFWNQCFINSRSPHRMLKMVVQRGRRRNKTGGVPLRYIEDFVSRERVQGRQQRKPTPSNSEGGCSKFSSKPQRDWPTGVRLAVREEGQATETPLGINPVTICIAPSSTTTNSPSKAATATFEQRLVRNLRLALKDLKIRRIQIAAGAHPGHHSPTRPRLRW